MALFTLVNGKMVYRMDLEEWFLQINKLNKEYLIITYL